jgi:serine/threonine protein kinase
LVRWLVGSLVGWLVGWLVRSNNENSSFDVTEFEREIGLMSNIKHRYIASCYGAVVSAGERWIVGRFYDNGDLMRYLSRNKQISWMQKICWCVEIALALEFLHAQLILHRDVKSMNVLLDAQLHAVLTDFGGSKRTESKYVSKTIGTTQWMPPELFAATPTFSDKGDVFAYAIVVWEIATEKEPYEEMEPYQIPALVAKGHRLEIPAECPKRVSELIRTCWNQNPAKRPSAAQLVQTLRTLAPE